MNWARANATQSALAAAEKRFEGVCDTDGEVDEDEVDAAYERMMRAASEADEALDAIKYACSDWTLVVSRVLR